MARVRYDNFVMQRCWWDIVLITFFKLCSQDELPQTVNDQRPSTKDLRPRTCDLQHVCDQGPATCNMCATKDLRLAHRRLRCFGPDTVRYCKMSARHPQHLIRMIKWFVPE